MMQVSRRGLLTGLATLIAAPTIVRVASIMPVRSLPSYWQDIPAPTLSFNEIVRQTLLVNRDRLAASVTMNNMLLQRLKTAGLIVPAPDLYVSDWS